MTICSKLRHLVIALVASSSLSLATGGDVFEAIEERQAQYEKAIEDGREEVLRAFTAEILKANEGGRTEDVARLTNHVKFFESAGIMMTSELYPHFIASGSKTHKARDLLHQAYKEAESESVKQLRLTKAEELRAVIKTKGLDSRLVSLRLAKRKIDFIQHAGYLGILAPAGGNPDRMNATFELMAGLADPKVVSFRSVNVPNHYLVHGNHRIRLQEFQDVEGFRQNATFKISKGQGNKSALMFVSVNFPTHCIHAREQELWLSQIEATGKFSDRAEFEIVDAQFPFWGKRD